MITWRRPQPWETGLALSLLLHLGVGLVFSWRWKVEIAEGAVDPMEIDLTHPFRITDNPALAHKALHPGAGAPVVEKPTPMAGKGQAGGQETPAEGKGAVKDWTLPDPHAHQVLEKPVDAAPAGQTDGQGEGAGLGGLGIGTGDGEVDWIYLTDRPKLLNREQLMKDVRHFYPEKEWDAGREGRVVVGVHIDGAGRVVRVDIVESAGDLFDQAAKKVLSRAKFSPAKVKEKSVPVKISFPLEFNQQ